MKNSRPKNGSLEGGNLKAGEKLELRAWLRLLGAVNPSHAMRLGVSVLPLKPPM